MEEEKRILVVDDDDAIRALLVTVLRRRAYKVDTARNGVEAMERCRTCRYSLVLLDLMMPRMSGYDVLDALAAEPPDRQPVVIVLTAGTEPRPLNSSLVTALVRKPFDVSLLLDMIAGGVTVRDAASQPAECQASDSFPDSTNEPN